MLLVGSYYYILNLKKNDFATQLQSINSNLKKNQRIHYILSKIYDNPPFFFQKCLFSYLRRVTHELQNFEFAIYIMIRCTEWRS